MDNRMKLVEYQLDGRRCKAFLQDGAKCLLVQPGDGNDLSVLEEELGLICKGSSVAFDMVFLGIEDWNSELSPWEAPPVFGKQGFGSGAEKTLAFIESSLIPDFLARFGLDPKTPVVLGGYSLAAFFSLWSAYRTELFSAVACASPSVWFPGWMEMARSGFPRSKHIYLSLGDKEEKTRNPVMATVGSCIRQMETILSEKGVDVILEWNQGNHFADTGLRCAKAFSWCLHSLMQR